MAWVKGLKNKNNLTSRMHSDTQSGAVFNFYRYAREMILL